MKSSRSPTYFDVGITAVEGGMANSELGVTTRVGTAGRYKVELPLDPGTLNERLFEIGVWLVEREIPHQARILMEPAEGVIRISFPRPDHAEAFRERFRQMLN